MRAIRVDEQASDLRTGTGGWFPEVDASRISHSYKKKMGIKESVERAPREGNRQADALANGCHDGFDPSAYQ